MYVSFDPAVHAKGSLLYEIRTREMPGGIQATTLVRATVPYDVAAQTPHVYLVRLGDGEQQGQENSPSPHGGGKGTASR